MPPRPSSRSILNGPIEAGCMSGKCTGRSRHGTRTGPQAASPKLTLGCRCWYWTRASHWRAEPVTPVPLILPTRGGQLSQCDSTATTRSASKLSIGIDDPSSQFDGWSSPTASSSKCIATVLGNCTSASAKVLFEVRTISKNTSIGRCRPNWCTSTTERAHARERTAQRSVAPSKVLRQ